MEQEKHSIIQNRIKAELAEQQKTGQWLAEKLGKGRNTFHDGAQTRCNHHLNN